MTFSSEGISTNQINRYIFPELDVRFEIHKKSSKFWSSSAPNAGTVIDLALVTFVNNKSGLSSSVSFDSWFKEAAVKQIKPFRFFGHDTTSSTTPYILHLHPIYPEILSRLRTEDDAVLGPDFLNQQLELPSTLAY